MSVCMYVPPRVSECKHVLCVCVCVCVCGIVCANMHACI
jgi:hypothetical protein